MGDIGKGVANTLLARQKIYKKKLEYGRKTFSKASALTELKGTSKIIHFMKLYFVTWKTSPPC
jgi:hypothetical protein